MNRDGDLALMFSGGKDSLAAFMRLDGSDRPRWLVTTYNEENDRVALHGTPIGLLRLQADRLGVALFEIPLPGDCDNSTYLGRVADGLAPLKQEGLARLAFGDLFLDDIRAFREAQCGDLGLEPVFPIWGEDTASMAERLPREGLDARVCCVDTETIDAAALGRRWTPQWLVDYAPDADPCGENGEFHTFVVDAPVFRAPIAVRPGRTVLSGGRFRMLDLQPA
ncbi:Dph6-related ATP pyrophosphatase [Halomonas denitrificans]|nr:hypothetical protein [Halomonas denitrificans]